MEAGELTTLRSHSLILRPKMPPATAPQQEDAAGQEKNLSSAAAIGSTQTTILGGVAARKPIATPPPASTPVLPGTMAQGNRVAAPDSAQTATRSRSSRSLLKRDEFSRLVAPPAALAPPIVVVPSTPSPTPIVVSPSPAGQPPRPPAQTAGTASLSWVPNNDPNLAGYRVYVGTSSGNYTYAGPFNVTAETSFTVNELHAGHTYFFAVSAYDHAGNESPKSEEVSKSLF